MIHMTCTSPTAITDFSRLLLNNEAVVLIPLLFWFACSFLLGFPKEDIANGALQGPHEGKAYH